MTFFSVLLALIIEQVRALSPSNPVFALFQFHAETVAHGLDAGKQKHGVLAWLAVVLPWVLIVALVYFLLYNQLRARVHLERRRRLFHARLSPVQPLLHRYPSRAQQR
jgi:hypothetical protein